MDSRNTSYHLGNKRKPRIFEDLPSSLQHTTVSNFNVVDAAPRRSKQSSRREKEEPNAHNSNININTEVHQILPQSTIAISELFSALMDPPEFQLEKRAEPNSLRVHYSADNNATESQSRNRKFTKLQIGVRAILGLMILFIIICCIAYFVEPKSTASVSFVLLRIFEYECIF
ncbi:hypothetical protein HNY73_022690 [Argiope bruennichi]|uniref:Uncharacterized protein n=1 Tax=Argiope bruennichi TaxID=94029 RepID=A0A8T0E2G3_ARGBR|nr:hypothetical protein HNY73_022690 [Argiope bruennichi]